MELQKKSELTVGRTSFVISTGLAGDAAPAIETKVLGSDGIVVFQTSQDISALKPIFQNSQKVFARLEAQHLAVIKELQQGRITETGSTTSMSSDPATATGAEDRESDALAHAVGLLGKRSFEKASAALRAVLETYPNCSEARELLEVSYKASSEARLPVDLGAALRRGTEAFAGGRQREAIESWKQCLIEAPENRRLQLLVLLATTWSQDRRQGYASEVLAPGSPVLSGGRPEEVQALLLVTQTAESVAAANVEPSPGQDAYDKTFVVPPPQSDEEDRTFVVPPPENDDAYGATMVVSPPKRSVEDATTVMPPKPPKHADALEATAFLPPKAPVSPMVDEALEATAIVSPPSFSDEGASGSSDWESLVSDYVEVEEPVVEPQSPPRPEPVKPVVSSRAPEPPAIPPPKPDPPPSPAPPVKEPETNEHVKPDPRPAAPASGGPAARKPAARPKQGAPWGLIGAVAAGVVVLGGLALWLLSGDGSVPPARIEQAASLVSSGQYAQALSAYDSLLDEFGDNAGIFLGRGRAKLASADTGGGLADLERAHALDPQAFAIAEEIADVLYSQNNYPAAIEYYEKAFQGGAGTAEGRYRFAVGLVREQRGAEAVEHLRAAIARDPTHGEAQFLLGQLLNEGGEHAEAERALRAAESNVEAGGDFLAQLGIALLEQQKLDEAEEIARDFIRSYPSDARARALLGEVYLSRKQYEPARAQLILALRNDPRDPRAQLALGRTWLAIGKSRNDVQDLGKAQQVLAAAQGIDEGKRLLVLGQVSLAGGNFPKAQSLLEQALGRGAPALPAHLSLAETKWKANDLVGAAEELHRASGLSPADPAISLSLAITYFQLKDPIRAADEFLKALQGIGLVTPPGPDAGPVVLPEPYVPLPDRFNVNRAIRDSVQAILKESTDDPTATQLQTLSDNTTFVVGNGS